MHGLKCAQGPFKPLPDAYRKGMIKLVQNDLNKTRISHTAAGLANTVAVDAILDAWDPSSLLLANNIFELSGESNNTATKIDQDGNLKNYLWTAKVMESGKHRMSLKLMKGEADYLNHFFGLVHDGAAWDKDHGLRAGTGAWYLWNDKSGLYGNGKQGDDGADRINEGQIVSMEADLDKGTLRFWVDGKPHGPGWDSGVTDRLRWAVSLYFYYQSAAVEIVPTPELQPWTSKYAMQTI